jgi:NAD(P)-dependent dehydrogenase (short-subunit alcohol dehydrogenase family)
MIRTIDVNLSGVIRTAHAALPSLRESRGHFLIVSSVAAFIASPGMAAYAASKAGVEHFGHALRLEVAHHGVTVGVAHPGWIDTDLMRDQQEGSEVFREVVQRLPNQLKSKLPVGECAQALADALENRARRIFIPSNLQQLLWVRPILATALMDRLNLRKFGDLIPRIEKECRENQESAPGESSFGRNSVETLKRQGAL